MKASKKQKNRRRSESDSDDGSWKKIKTEEPTSLPVSPPLLSACEDIRRGAATAENVLTEDLVCPRVAQLAAVVARWLHVGRQAMMHSGTK